MLNYYETQPNGETNIGHYFAAKKICFVCPCKILADTFFLVSMAILDYFHIAKPYVFVWETTLQHHMVQKICFHLLLEEGWNF